MEKINVLHIYQNSKVGGIQQQILNLFKEYDSAVFNPIFCCLGPKKDIGKEIEKLGFDCIALNRKRYHKFSPGIVIDIYKLIKKRHIHILRTHKYRANLYGRLAGWLAGVNVMIASLHIDYGNKDEYLGRRISNRLLSNVTDKIIAVSESVKRDAIKYDRIEPLKISVIRNGVDTDKFDGAKFPDNIKNEFSVTEKDIVIGFVGRIVNSKGLIYLINAFSQLKKTYDNISLFIVGDGSLRDDLEKEVKKIAIHNNVVFTGKRRNIPDFLSCFDIFVLPSIKEGLPNSLLEAMAMGKPIVAAKVGGIPEVLQNGTTGLIVPPRDPESLAKAIKSLIDDEHRAKNIGNAARKFILENYSIKSTVQKWQTLYISILKTKGMLNMDIEKNIKS